MLLLNELAALVGVLALVGGEGKAVRGLAKRDLTRDERIAVISGRVTEGEGKTSAAVSRIAEIDHAGALRAEMERAAAAAG